jgi:hypothetical protein
VTDTLHLAVELRRLVEYAAAGGAPHDWLERLAGELVDELLERADPRRRETLERAHQVAIAEEALRRQGADRGEVLEALEARFGRSRRTLYRLLECHDILAQLRAPIGAPSPQRTDADA